MKFLVGKHPIVSAQLSLLISVMRANQEKEALTFGKFIATVYDACGRQKAKGIVRLVVKAHWVEFRGHDRFAILEPDLDKKFSFL